MKERAQLNSIGALAKRYTRKMPEDTSPLQRVEEIIKKQLDLRLELKKLRLTVKQLQARAPQA
jgi:hypothetical protein